MAEVTADFLRNLVAPKTAAKGNVRSTAARSQSSLDAASLVRRVREGLPARSFAVLRDAIKLPTERLARLVHIPLRTLARRQVFKADESERILRLGRLFQRACEVLGSDDEARRWLLAPQKALGNLAPLDFADTEPGAREVEDLLGRLEHGVFS